MARVRMGDTDETFDTKSIDTSIVVVSLADDTFEEVMSKKGRQKYRHYTDIAI